MADDGNSCSGYLLTEQDLGRLVFDELLVQNSIGKQGSLPAINTTAVLIQTTRYLNLLSSLIETP
jgi:hypothetical protein